MKFIRRISKGARVARRLGPHLDGQRRPLVIAGALSLAAVALEILRPWPLKWIFDGALVPVGEPSYEASSVIWIGAGAALAIALARTAFQYLATMRLTAVGHSVTRSLRLQLFGHLAELDPGFHAEHKSGDLLVRLMGDVPMVRTMLVESRVTLITRVILAVVTVAVMIWLDPLMTLLVVALLPVVFAVVRFLSRSIAVAVRKQRKKEGALADFLQESLLATDVIQSLGGTDQTVRRFARGNRTSARAEMKAARAAARLTAFVESSIGLATAGTLVLGALRVADGHLTPGELLVFLSYVRSLSKPSRTTAKQMIKVAKGTACGERILSILEGHQGIRARSGAVPAPEQPDSIAFEGVTYTYEGAPAPAVSGLDLKLRRGSMTALFGESGAGKSTVTRLALRLFDPEVGRVLMDGRDLRELDVDSVRARFALSMQDTVLFGDSVRDNLLLGSPEKSDAEIFEALETAGARKLVEALPEGLDSMLGALGAGLSGGERRRLCLARALLRQSPILVVDEPFAGLDERTASKLEITLRDHACEHIVLVVTHDVARLARFDHVAFLDGGRLRDEGTHTELLERNPGYAKVCNLLTESTP